MATCIQCDEQALEGGDYCAKCEEKAFKKIGGWLYLPALGLLATLLVNAFSIIVTLRLLLDNAGQLPGVLQGVLYFELSAFAGLFLLALYVSSLFVRKKRQLPKSYIALLVAGIAILGIDAWLGYRYLDIPLSYDTVSPIVRSVIGACIWIPYFLVSVRVKRTFVR